MPAVVPSTLNGTFTVFTPTEVALLLEAIKSPARVSNWLKTRMFRHVHMLDFTHTNMRTHFSSNYYTTLLAGPPPEMPSAQQTDSTCSRLIDFNCHILYARPLEDINCVYLCVWVMCAFSSIRFSRMRYIELVCQFQHSHSESSRHRALMASHGGKLLAAC